MRHIFLSIALGVIVFLVYVAYYVGAFKTVEISLESRGPYTAIYKVHRGAYHKIVPTIEEVETWVQENTDDLCRKSFGQYLDDTSWVEEDRLTSRGGCLLESPVPDPIPDDFELMEIPQERYVVARFSGSPGIGPLKVYPRVSRWAKQQSLTLSSAVIEIYEILEDDAMITEYLFALER